MCVFGFQDFGILLLIREAFSSFAAMQQNPGLYVGFIVFCLLLPLIAYPEAISRFSWNIHMDESRIWMNGDKLAPKRFRIQSKTEACFFEIVTLSIEDTTKNGSGQSMASWFYGPRWSRKRYLVLTLVSG